MIKEELLIKSKRTDESAENRLRKESKFFRVNQKYI